MKRYFIVATLFLNSLLLSGLSLNNPVMRPECIAKDSECTLYATYWESTNTTYWAAVCTDGIVINGALGGNNIPAICNV